MSQAVVPPPFLFPGCHHYAHQGPKLLSKTYSSIQAPKTQGENGPFSQAGLVSYPIESI